MRILAIDTSGEACAVGIAGGERRIARSETIGRGHGERLFALLREAVEGAGAEFAGFDRIAVTVGPGSFTGLRVGIAAARGLALATGASTLGFSTLAVHAAEARRAGCRGPLLVVLPARGDLLYGQMFPRQGQEPEEPRLASAAAFAHDSAAVGAAIAGAGARTLTPLLGNPIIVHERSQPSVEDLLDLAGAAVAPLPPPKPLYLAEPDIRPAVPAGAP
ncbi:MAG: tRNA (adenosine(37)-N6)-threonylcarbamoyltransferase complex dimerization subunit type 1 TsaB [Bauldia sp.]